MKKYQILRIFAVALRCYTFDLERQTIDNKSFVVGYHTQEFRYEEALNNPLKCRASDAWLGIGYYFWTDLEFAKYWGEDFKTLGTGCYDIYKADLNVENCLNTTFNEEHYFFFQECIECAIQDLKKSQSPKNQTRITLKREHEFLSEKYWQRMSISGIIYDDMPYNPPNKQNRKYSVIEHKEGNNSKFFYYKKRIQIVIFNLKDILNFKLFLEEQS